MSLLGNNGGGGRRTQPELREEARPPTPPPIRSLDLLPLSPPVPFHPTSIDFTFITPPNVYGSRETPPQSSRGSTHLESSVIQDFFADAILPLASSTSSALSNAPLHPPLTTSIEEGGGPNGTFFKCSIDGCTRSYRRRGDLKFHIMRKHSTHRHLAEMISPPKSDKTGKAYTCPIDWCKCGYKWSRDLKRHLNSKHKDERGVIVDVVRGQEVRLDSTVTFNEKFTAKWVNRSSRSPSSSGGRPQSSSYDDDLKF